MTGMPQVGALHRGVGRKTWRAVALGRLPPPKLPSYNATVYCISSTRALILSLPLRLTRNCCITKRSCWTMETNGKLKLLQIYRQTSCTDRHPMPQMPRFCKNYIKLKRVLCMTGPCFWTGTDLLLLSLFSLLWLNYYLLVCLWTASMKFKFANKVVFPSLICFFVQTILCTLPKVLRTDSRRKTTHPCACRQPVHGLH